MGTGSGHERQVVEIDGHEITLTNLTKVMYPEEGTTKGDVIDYYRSIAPRLLPLLAGRPVTRKRWVHGTGSAPFFHKALDDSTPEWVTRVTLQHVDHTSDYPIVDSAATLVWLAQIAALELHVPQWRFPADGAVPGLAAGEAYPPASGLLHPDRLVLDLDPGEGAGLPECVEVAGLLRAALAEHGLDPEPVTSGSKGIHLYAPLDGTYTSDGATDLAHSVAEAIAGEHPDLVVTDIRTARRTGKVLIDWSQNRAGKTTVSPLSLRGRARPFVAAPRTWEELADPGLRQLTASEVLQRASGG